MATEGSEQFCGGSALWKVKMLRRPMLSPLHFARWSQPPALHRDFCTPETQFPDNRRADAAG